MNYFIWLNLFSNIFYSSGYLSIFHCLISLRSTIMASTIHSLRMSWMLRGQLRFRRAFNLKTYPYTITSYELVHDWDTWSPSFYNSILSSLQMFNPFSSLRGVLGAVNNYTLSFLSFFSLSLSALLNSNGSKPSSSELIAQGG